MRDLTERRDAARLTSALAVDCGGWMARLVLAPSAPSEEVVPPAAFGAGDNVCMKGDRLLEMSRCE